MVDRGYLRFTDLAYTDAMARLEAQDPSLTAISISTRMRSDAMRGSGWIDSHRRLDDTDVTNVIMAATRNRAATLRGFQFDVSLGVNKFKVSTLKLLCEALTLLTSLEELYFHRRCRVETRGDSEDRFVDRSHGMKIPDFLFTSLEGTCHFTHLRVLSLCRCGLKNDGLPDEVGNLSTLQVLDLENNRLERIPATCTSLINLIWLNLHNNILDDFGATAVSYMFAPHRCLLGLEISRNKIGVDGCYDLIKILLYNNETLIFIRMDQNPGLVCDVASGSRETAETGADLMMALEASKRSSVESIRRGFTKIYKQLAKARDGDDEDSDDVPLFAPKRGDAPDGGGGGGAAAGGGYTKRIRQMLSKMRLVF